MHNTSILILITLLITACATPTASLPKEEQRSTLTKRADPITRPAPRPHSIVSTKDLEVKKTPKKKSPIIVTKKSVEEKKHRQKVTTQSTNRQTIIEKRSIPSQSTTHPKTITISSTKPPRKAFTTTEKKSTPVLQTKESVPKKKHTQKTPIKKAKAQTIVPKESPPDLLTKRSEEIITTPSKQTIQEYSFDEEAKVLLYFNKEDPIRPLLQKKFQIDDKETLFLSSLRSLENLSIDDSVITFILMDQSVLLNDLENSLYLLTHLQSQKIFIIIQYSDDAFYRAVKKSQGNFLKSSFLLFKKEDIRSLHYLDEEIVLEETLKYVCDHDNSECSTKVLGNKKLVY